MRLCTHEESCEERPAHSATCGDVCVDADAVHDHVVVEVQDVILAGKTVSVKSATISDVMFKGIDYGGIGFFADRTTSGFRERWRDDGYAVVLVQLTRRLC